MRRSRALSILMVVAMVAVMVGVPMVDMTVAQSATDATYTSPTYGYTIRYGDRWRLVEEGSENRVDRLHLTNDVSTVDFTGSATTGDAEACLAAAGDALLDEDPYRQFGRAVTDAGDPYGGQGFLGAYTGFTDGETAVYLECGLNPNQTVSLLVRHVVALASFPDEIELINDLLFELTWKATTIGGRFGGRSAEATAATSPTPDPGVASGSPTSPAPRRYVDARNGWSISWDESWELDSDPASDGFLKLLSGETVLFISVRTNIDNARRCLSDKLAELNSDGNVSGISVLWRDGDPVRGGDAANAFVAYVYSHNRDGETLTLVDHYICWILPSGDDALVVSHIVPEDLYDAEVPLVAALLKGLVIDD